MPDYKKLGKRLDYQFRSQDLLVQALTHRSVGKLNNERLEFLGDSILNFVITDELFSRFPDAREGDLSRVRSFLVKGDKLTEIANEIELGEILELGPGELKTGGFRRASILEDAMEALIGSVYLDGGYDAARHVIMTLYRDSLDRIPPFDELKDPKTRLQEYLQSQRLPLPEYEIVEITGEQHNKMFKVSCNVEGLQQPTFGTARSRRKAEQISAREALAILMDEH